MYVEKLGILTSNVQVIYGCQEKDTAIFPLVKPCTVYAEYLGPAD